MKHTKELAYLRQLCCLGLPKETFIPEFLQAIASVIPSQNNTYSGVDPSEFKPADLSMPVDQLDMANIVQQVMNDYWVPERANRVASWFQKNPVLTDFTVFDEHYQNSDLMNLVFKPLDQYHPLLVFLTSQGKLVGAINLFRPRAQKPFNTNEQALLLRLMPYVSHAFQNQNMQELQYVNKGVTSLLLMDKAGNIQYQNATAERLLMLASYPLVPTDTIIKNDFLLPKLKQLCRNLNTLFEGHDATPPSFCHINGRGRFIFTAYWLDKANREPGGLIGMTIEHQEPLALKILRAMQDLPLSPVQKEVALLLAQGVSSEKIGERLHIKYTTVKDHVRKIFDKLDIHQREELLPKLLAKERERLVQLV
jgi:DNA-binding CsgD family transcriptional regulator